MNTIRKARRITFAEINERWLETDMSGGVDLARSTFARHKDAIEDIFGIYIDCDRQNGYQYFIGNDYVLREDSVQNWMLSTLSVNNVISKTLYPGEKYNFTFWSSNAKYPHTASLRLDFSDNLVLKLIKEQSYTGKEFQEYMKSQKTK